MTQIINIPNYGSDNLQQQTRISQEVQIGDLNVSIENSEGYAIGKFIIMGTPGAETTEINTVQAVVSSTLLSVSTPVKLFHAQYEYLYALFGDTINIYRAPNVDGSQPADSSFALLANVPIQSGSSMTEYGDPDGSDAYWYKFTYFNSVTHAETLLADSKCVRGGGANQYVSIMSIRKAAGFEKNTNIADPDIDEKRQIAQAEVNSALASRYDVPFKAPINAMVENITRMIAVKYLHLDQYGVYDADNSTGKQIDLAEQQLKDLRSGQLSLIGIDGKSQQKPQGSVSSDGTTGDLGFSGWPNQTTAKLQPVDEGSGDFMFKRADIDGYRERQY